MQETEDNRARPAGRTSGTDRRPPHELREPVTALDLLDEAAGLRREPTWQQSDRNAKTFVKAGDLRLVLTTLKQGAVVTEQIFRVPGIGSLLISSIQNNDTPVIMAIVMVFATLVVFFTLVADLLYGVLDPRIRLG